jgi:hypothetical protein
MEFSTLLITPAIVEPLRYYFSTYTRESGVYWDADEKLRTVEIGGMYDYNQIPFGQRPRILVDRGTYAIGKAGLSNSLASGKTMRETQGLQDNINKLFYNGSATIQIEARNFGTCELLADMVSHFVAWTRPVLCDTQGWSEFGLPMTVSNCVPATPEDAEIPKFQVSIQLPWAKEEQWRTRNDGVALKAVFKTLTNGGVGQQF